VSCRNHRPYIGVIEPDPIAQQTGKALRLEQSSPNGRQSVGRLANAKDLSQSWMINRYSNRSSRSTFRPLPEAELLVFTGPGPFPSSSRRTRDLARDTRWTKTIATTNTTIAVATAIIGRLARVAIIATTVLPPRLAN